MFDRPVFLPLAQLNTTGTGPAAAPPGAAPAGVLAPAPAPGVVPPAVEGVAGVAGTATAPGTTTQAATQPAPPAGGLGQLMFPFILMLVVLYFFMFRGQRKTDKKRKALLADLKKGDKVMTIGGMVANVVSVDGEEVVLKIDESANVKARYRKSAIQEVLGVDEKK